MPIVEQIFCQLVIREKGKKHPHIFCFFLRGAIILNQDDLSIWYENILEQSKELQGKSRRRQKQKPNFTYFHVSQYTGWRKHYLPVFEELPGIQEIIMLNPCAKAR